MHPATPLIQAIWTCLELIGRGREKYQSPKYGPMTSQWKGDFRVCVCMMLVLIAVKHCVCPLMCECVFFSPRVCICCSLLMCVRACALVSMCWTPDVFAGACQGAEGSARPPDGGYRSCLSPSLINFFPDWLWLLINKTWSGDQMQISSWVGRVRVDGRAVDCFFRSIYFLPCCPRL